MLKRLKFIIYTRPFITFAYYLIRLYSSTFRIRVKNEKEWQSLVASGTPTIICTWHQLFFPAIWYFRNYAPFCPSVMISRSRDGELISGVAKRIGWETVRGSSSRGGKQALGQMIQHVKTHGFGAHILDGPTGPMGTVKAGAIKMALETGAVLVPFYAKAEDAWFFNSWDRFMLPKPFSRVSIEFDPPMVLDPENLDFETLRQNLETQMLPGLYLN